MDAQSLPTDIENCHRLIATLDAKVDRTQQTLNKQAGELQRRDMELALKAKLVEEQANSVLELIDNKDRLDEKVIELNLTIEKLLKQLYGRNDVNA